MKVTDTHVFFWGGILSNFAEVPGGIRMDGMRFPTSEHLFMWFKATYFKDQETADRILSAQTPREAKKLGRQVKNFDNEAWEEVREECMLSAVSMKSEFWPEFKEELLKYGNRSFVEASPYDAIWGIAMGEDEASVEDPGNWRGLNLLGKVLDKVRDEVKNKGY